VDSFIIAMVCTMSLEVHRNLAVLLSMAVIHSLHSLHSLAVLLKLGALHSLVVLHTKAEVNTLLVAINVSSKYISGALLLTLTVFYNLKVHLSIAFLYALVVWAILVVICGVAVRYS
jgi:hypothetical protein